jgi:hypothetical protein
MNNEQCMASVLEEGPRIALSEICVPHGLADGGTPLKEPRAIMSTFTLRSV